MSKNVLEKIINNGIEYYFPEGGGGSSDLDIGAVNALIDMKLGDYDSLFSVTNGLYQILNSIDTEDEIGLSSGDTRAEIVADDTSMSLISHCYAVMCYIANSTVAMSTILADASATNEISECWNSITIIAESQLASDLYLASVNGITSLFTYQTAQDAFFTSTARKTQIVTQNLMVIVNDDTLLAQLNTDSVVQACIVNSTTALSTIAGDHDKLEIVKENTAIMNAIAVNSTALAAMSDSDFFEYILEDSTYLTICAGSTNGKAKINSYAADDLLDPIYFWTGDLGYSTFAALAADDTSMEIVQANNNAMKIINANEECSSYLGYIPNANTLLYYSFDNQDLSDLSGKGNNGTWYNGAGTFVDGIKGKCAHIAGTRGIRIPITFPTGDFTYSICAYTTNLSSPQIQSFLGTIERGTNYGVFHFHRTSGNQIVIATSRDGTNRPTSGYMEANKRINIILTRSGNVRKIYKNGTQIFNQTIAYSMSGGTWTVGCEYTDGRAINGNIDEVILENRAWTDAEILKYVQKLGLA